MATVREMPPAVQKYLEELELCLKRNVGVAPEEALSDAREYLLSDADALTRSGERISDDDLYSHFAKTFGDPAAVAEHFAKSQPGAPLLRPTIFPQPGYAPGWRICCTACGRSAPLAALGGIRIGARSVHKYTVGWCRECGWLRFMRIIQDLDSPNLTAQLGMTNTPAQALKSLHHPVLTIVGILAFTFAIIGAVWLLTAALARGQDGAAGRAAAQRLQKAIDQDYSHRDRKGVKWQERFAEYQPKLGDAATADQFAATAAELLAPAEDIHLWLKVGDKLVPTFRRDMQPNINPRVLPRLIPTLKQHGKTVLVGQLADGIRYVAIGAWENREPDSMEAAIAAVADAAKSKAPLIIDVRPNTGGDERIARRVAGFFVAAPTVYAKHVIHRAGADSPVQERVLQPAESGLHHPGPCLVLMGSANFSSCEAFLLMMRAAGCRLVGEKSFGSSGNPQPVDLGNGVTAFVPSWRSLVPDGSELEGVGITPDIEVATKTADFQNADPVLTKALAILRSRQQN
jgi:hypothetical protein